MRDFAAILLLVTLAGCSDEAARADATARVKFASPPPYSVLRGFCELKVESSLDASISAMNIQIDGETVDHFPTLLTSLRLDTTALPQGARQLGVEVVTEAGERYSDTLEVSIENPKHRLVRATQSKEGYGRGEQVAMVLEYSEPELVISADFSGIDSGFAANRVQIHQDGDGRYELRYQLSDVSDTPPGRYEIPVTSTGADGIALESQVMLHFLGAPRLPLMIASEGAIFADQAPQLTLGASAPEIRAVELPVALSEGVVETLTLSWAAPEDNPADRVIVRSRARSGAWVVPLPEPSTNGSIQLPTTISSRASQLSADRLDLSIAAVGTNGTSAGSVDTEIPTVMLSPSNMRVLLRWSGEADLDLAVTTPARSRIDFDHPSAEGGELEADSNALCATSRVPVEAITWPTDGVTPGEYGIEVSLFDDCGQVEVNYEVLIYACGEVKRFFGRFGSADPHASRIQPLDPFVVDCMQRLKGRVTYDKGNPGSRDARAAAQVPVRVLGTGASEAPSTITDADGYYDISFSVGEGAHVSLEVEAAWMPPGAATSRAKVVGMTGNHAVSVSSSVPAIERSIQTHDVMIGVVEGSGAFNLLENMRHSYAWVGSNFSTSTNAVVKDVVVRWERGKDTPDGGSYSAPVSASSKRNGQIWISGAADDPDEFDDSVITHEFVHCFAGNLGIDDSPGGDHLLTDRVAPNMAWSEGLATALGQQILGTPEVKYEGELLEGWVNIENTLNDASQGQAFGTTNARSMTGKLNEFLVAAVLWDLLDPSSAVDADDIDDDRIDGTHFAVTGALSGYLNSSDWVKRGAQGRDLVDFIDGWRCYDALAAAHRGNQPLQAELAALLKGRRFVYTPPTQALTCR